jgi:cyclopropane fatty-acyl-phospholipid synthase-like methyltransferase
MNPWVKLWQTTTGFDENMRNIMPFFVKKISKYINEKDTVLDIGCGPGYLEEFLSPKVNEICGLDISEKYINDCRKKFENSNCCFFPLNPDNYFDYSMLKGKLFSKVIVLSVIQYFNSIEEVKKLIVSLKPNITPGGIMIIADVVVKDGKVSDASDLFFYLLLKGKIASFIRFISFTFFSSYHKTRNTAKLLVIPLDKLKKLGEELNLENEIVKNLTIHSSRKNLILKF